MIIKMDILYNNKCWKLQINKEHLLASNSNVKKTSKLLEGTTLKHSEFFKIKPEFKPQIFLLGIILGSINQKYYNVLGYMLTEA